MNFVNQFFGGRREPQHFDTSGPGPLRYQNFLRAYPSTFMAKEELERGNKVLLPSSVLAELTNHGGALPHPLIFRINSMRVNKTIYCGVLEFTAPEETCILPLWIFQEVGLLEEELINIFLVPHLPKAQMVKIRPHQTAFIELPDPRAFLEIKFRAFVCLSEGSTISVITDLPSHPIFKFDIMDVTPTSPFKTVSVINCDLKLDFEAPLDYVEPAPEPKLEKKDSHLMIAEESEFSAFTGNYQRLDGKKVKGDPTAKVEEYDPRKHKLKHGIRDYNIETYFKGQGVSLK